MKINRNLPNSVKGMAIQILGIKKEADIGET